MITNQIFGSKEFKTKKELFHSLKDNEHTIIGLKKSTVFKSIEKGQSIPNLSIIPKSATQKNQYESGFTYAAINSTHWLDSHQDVHIKGCYTRTVKEQQGRVYYIDTHMKGLSNIITMKNDIEMFYDDIEWSLLGKNIQGTTEALFFKMPNDKIKTDYLNLIQQDKELQNSLAMTYKNIVMAIDSDDSEFKENKDVFDKYIDTIANKEQAQKDGIFFAVKELAIMGEGSLCPIVGGSNSATSVFQIKDIQNGKPTEPTAAEKSLQEQKRNYLISKNKRK